MRTAYILRDEIIRDRIVVGLRNSALSEKLQMDPTLTLEKATAKARQSEAVKKQKSLLHSDFQESSHKFVESIQRVKPSKGQRKGPDGSLITPISMLHVNSPQSLLGALDAVELPPTQGRCALLEMKNAISVVKREAICRSGRNMCEVQKETKEAFLGRCRTPRTPTHGL